ncbi:DUF4062 domain-containing protein [Hymenobacter caeli]|uniref:DUF4062 domain-containing protein n=1 Tax=Hymenobacter caeli TaxID=2735894 RepID=A0ABX2FRZ0_9BACT|nr:DUF4062 domain-containing protein [Hymenobacter caeli]NRT19948.1 hypothetical protein [Hymenobacter caeli]
MKNKLQVFISSTFSDLQLERQAAVEAVLRSGHISAGMELFSAGNESQLEIIKRWIDESDVYMLILGGRYGSIEKKSGLSYTEIEYRYAVEKNKPVFSIVVSDSLLKAKVKKNGLDVIERDDIKKYNQFKELVLSKICRFFNNNTEIKLAVLESLLDIQSRFNLKGWIRYEDVPDMSSLLKQLSLLQNENTILKKELLSKNNKVSKELFGILNYEQLKQLLLNEKINIPKSVSNMNKDVEQSYFDVFTANAGIFNTGVDNQVASGEANHLMYKIASDMIAFGLIEQKNEKRGQRTASVLRTSSDGRRFIAESTLKNHQAGQMEEKVESREAESNTESKS